MAGKWEKFAEDGDDYPLQYRTAGDDKVRPEHAELNGITLPPSDSFWDSYFPPNGWNCRCTVVQVLARKNPLTPHDEAMSRAKGAMTEKQQKMFAFNPGKQQRVFPKYNPYTISKCTSCNQSNLKLAFAPDNEVCQACKFVHSCLIGEETVYKAGKGVVRISKLIRTDSPDYDKLKQIAEHFASLGSEVEMTPKMSRPQNFVYDCYYKDLRGTKYENKCPDLKIDGVWYEHEGFITDNAKNAFRNMMRDGLKQSSRLIIDKPALTNRYMLNSIFGRIGRREAIDEVWLRTPEGNLTLLYKKTDG